ncbi:MAG: tetratricopeptide repeat protein [Pseudomonadales bacterium]|nr:tetratricopeptide repeat protein [Pseudomonadales bacterium]
MSRIVLVIAWAFSLILAAYAGMRYEQLNAPSETAQPVTTTVKTTVPVKKTAEPLDQVTGSSEEPIQALINGGRYFAAIELILAALSETPDDFDLRFLLASLYNETHQFDEAISELLTIRSLSLDDQELSRARREIDQIARSADQRFVTRRASNEAIAFFERQTVQEPSYDLHRYLLAKWLLNSGVTSSAERLIQELGLSGVTSSERDALKEKLVQLRSRLPIRREGSAMYADVEVTTPTGTSTLTLLVDTGATLTAISQLQLRELGATRTPHRVQAQTANGTIDVAVYGLQSISGGPLTLDYFLVGALGDLPDHVDGLLGLDFLDQLPVPIVNTQ